MGKTLSSSVFEKKRNPFGFAEQAINIDETIETVLRALLMIRNAGEYEYPRLTDRGQVVVTRLAKAGLVKIADGERGRLITLTRDGGEAVKKLAK